MPPMDNVDVRNPYDPSTNAWAKRLGWAAAASELEQDGISRIQQREFKIDLVLGDLVAPDKYGGWLTSDECPIQDMSFLTEEYAQLVYEVSGLQWHVAGVTYLNPKDRQVLYLLPFVGN